MVGLVSGRSEAVTVGSMVIMGIGGGTLLVTIQAALADAHGERRAVAMTEANVVASVAYVVLIGVLSLAAALGVGWRAALLAALALLPLAFLGQPAGRDAGVARGAEPRARRAAEGVLDRRGDDLLHHRGRVVHQRLGRELRRSRPRTCPRTRRSR